MTMYATCSIHTSYDLLDLLTSLWAGGQQVRLRGLERQKVEKVGRSNDTKGDVKSDRMHIGSNIWSRFESKLHLFIHVFS